MAKGFLRCQTYWLLHMLKAGEGITTIKIDQALSNGEHTCQIECDVYRDTGVYIGQFTSQFNLLV